MTQELIHETTEELIERFPKDRKERHKELQSAKFKIEILEDKIKKLQQEYDLYKFNFSLPRVKFKKHGKQIYFSSVKPTKIK